MLLQIAAGDIGHLTDLCAEARRLFGQLS